MNRQLADVFAICALWLVTAGCSSNSKPQETFQETVRAHKPSDVASPATSNPLIGRIWHIPNSPYGAAAGSIYVFLPNGTLLETSCVETYRIATWTADKNDNRTVHVVEDQRPAFDATVVQASADSLQLKQTLSMGNRETRDLNLTQLTRNLSVPI